MRRDPEKSPQTDDVGKVARLRLQPKRACVTIPPRAERADETSEHLGPSHALAPRRASPSEGPRVWARSGAVDPALCIAVERRDGSERHALPPCTRRSLRRRRALGRGSVLRRAPRRAHPARYIRGGRVLVRDLAHRARGPRTALAFPRTLERSRARHGEGRRRPRRHRAERQGLAVLRGAACERVLRREPPRPMQARDGASDHSATRILCAPRAPRHARDRARRWDERACVRLRQERLCARPGRRERGRHDRRCAARRRARGSCRGTPEVPSDAAHVRGSSAPRDRCAAPERRAFPRGGR